MWLMSWNSTSIMYAQYQVHLKITRSPSLKHFSPIAISICWASSVHETGKILRTGGRTVSYVALVVTFGILQFLREVTEVLPCLFLPEHDALERLQEVEVQEQVLDTCRAYLPLISFQPKTSSELLSHFMTVFFWTPLHL